jgi:hypothetical protein
VGEGWGVTIHGVTLHNYRYSWAERSADNGFPERYAQRAWDRIRKSCTEPMPSVEGGLIAAEKRRIEIPFSSAWIFFRHSR